MSVKLVFPWLSTTEKQEPFEDFDANLLTDSSKFFGNSSETCWWFRKWCECKFDREFINTLTKKRWFLGNIWWNHLKDLRKIKLMTSVTLVGCSNHWTTRTSTVSSTMKITSKSIQYQWNTLWISWSNDPTHYKFS